MIEIAAQIPPWAKRVAELGVSREKAGEAFLRIQPKAEYSVSDQISLNLGMNYFLPGPDKEKPGTYGEYKKLSCITVGGKFSF